MMKPSNILTHLRLAGLALAAAMAITAAPETATAQSPWVVVSAGPGYTLYAHEVDGQPWKNPHWVQVQDRNWNQHLVLVKADCHNNAVRVQEGVFVRSSGRKEAWLKSTGGAFSQVATEQDAIVADLLNLACAGWPQGNNAWTALNGPSPEMHMHPETGGLMIVKPAETAHAEAIAVYQETQGSTDGMIIGVDSRRPAPNDTTAMRKAQDLALARSGITAVCTDNYLSRSGSLIDACLHHGGVKRWMPRR